MFRFLQKKSKIFSVISFSIVISLCSSGCAAMMAANQPDYTDLAFLHNGVSRTNVVAELGKPILSEKDAKGNLIETYQFKQGYKTSTRVIRIMFHVAADVFTLFLWEFIGMPMETAFDGNVTTVNTTYDNKKKIAELKIIEKK
ncbi:MAG: hypothetical protein HRT89_07515 [Lentisphaeria bacterium]|nr:hypothetical protein [Lentisphaeria bacterium]NQZ67902.1 hypothetical protein [Lentisphaeria bacterium]